MKKFIFSLVAMLTLVLATVSAQSQSNYACSSKFTDNWSIGINGGVQTNLHDWQSPQGAVVGITLNKEITPIVGFTAEVGTGINNRCNWYSHTSHICNGVVFDQISAFADGRINLTNAFLGYKGSKRFFEVSTITGVGYGHGYINGGADGTDALLAKGGFNVSLNLSDAIAINITPAVIWNVSQTGQFNSNFGVGQITAGLTYSLGTSNGTHHITKAVLRNEAEINSLNAEISRLKGELARKPIATPTIEKVKEVVADTVFISPKVQFVKNGSEISPTSTATVKDIADAIKDNGKKYTILGYASVDGNEASNLALSQSRADAVKNALVKAGANASNLEAIGKGQTTQFGDDLEDNRIVILEQNK